MAQAGLQTALASSYIKLFLELADEKGWPREELFAGTCLAGNHLKENHYLDFDTVCRFTHNLIRVSNTPNLGLMLGEKMHLASHGVLSHALMGAGTQLDALLAVKNFLKIRTSIVELELEFTEKTVTVVFNCPVPFDAAVERLTYEAGMSAACGVVRYLNHMDPILEVGFIGEEPADIHAFQRCFGKDVHFHCEKTYMTLRLDVLNKTTHTGNESVFRAAEQECDALLTRLQGGRIIVSEKVRQLLLEKPDSPINQDSMAKHLHISTRTLRRQLQQEGTTYQQVLDDVHKELALRYFQQGCNSVEEIATLLGYSDTANFARAFRRWTGLSPTQYKRNEYVMV